MPAYAQDLFGPATNYPTGDSPESVFIADLDGDGDNDLAVANWGSFDPDSRKYINSSVSVLLNNGDGQFAPKMDYETGTNPQSVFIADLDGDGDNDLAVANRFSDTVSVLLNNGDGQFATKVDYPVGIDPF